MSNTSKSKTNILWMFFTAIIFLFRESNKPCAVKDSLSKTKRNGFELLFIESNADLNKINERGSVILVDYIRRQSHIQTIQYFITKTNVSVLYIDTLEKASIANKLGFTKANKIYLFDKKKYLKNLKIEIEDEMMKIKGISSAIHRMKYLKYIRRRINAHKLSKYDEKYHFENIELLIYYKLRVLHKIAAKFFLNNKSSVLFLSFLISNLVNSFFFLIK